MSVKRTKYEIEISINPLRGREDDISENLQVTGVNGSLVFSPAGRRLRGEYDTNLLGRYDLNERMRLFTTRVGSVPGERVWIDIQAKKWGTVDPLHKPETPSLKRKAEKLVEQMQSIFGQRVKFTEPLTKDIGDPDEAKNVLYWMRRALDANHAKTVGGDLPSMDEIKAMPGKRDVWNGIQPSHDEKTAAFAERNNYEVAPPAEKKTAATK